MQQCPHLILHNVTLPDIHIIIINNDINMSGSVTIITEALFTLCAMITGINMAE